MSVAIEFINFIVPIQIIKDKYMGGWEQCRSDHEHMIGGKIWFDEYLFRDGAMNPMDMESIVKWWEAKGFDIIVEKNGKRQFKDGCVVEGMFGGVTIPCDWICATDDGRGVYLTGTEPGEMIGRRR